MPLVGQAGVGAVGTPSKVGEQPAMEVIPLPTMGRMELPTALVVPTAAGTPPPVKAPPTLAEVAATVTGEAQSDATMVVPKEAARSAPPAAQVTTPDVGTCQFVATFVRT